MKYNRLKLETADGRQYSEATAWIKTQIEDDATFRHFRINRKNVWSRQTLKKESRMATGRSNKLVGRRVNQDVGLAALRRH